MPMMCLLYSCKASMRAWMCRRMKELLACYSFVGMSTMDIICVLKKLPRQSKCSMVPYFVV